MATITIKQVIESLEKLAPQWERYDNSGLITGQAADDVNFILVTLDYCTEAVVEEAISKSCNLITSPTTPFCLEGSRDLLAILM
ncbi:MAG: Nif3-like dinuclear metal center hexameric protein [Flammeovirgaceae bacterium]|nr:Nif3-like dinuclear metal center hexameric protein [Flammeovirgaceae bacterium]